MSFNLRWMKEDHHYLYGSFELIFQAYQVLSNEELRRDYDERRAVRVHVGVNAEDVYINEFDRDDDSCDDDRYYHRQCQLV